MACRINLHVGMPYLKDDAMPLLLLNNKENIAFKRGPEGCKVHSKKQKEIDNAIFPP